MSVSYYRCHSFPFCCSKSSARHPSRHPTKPKSGDAHKMLPSSSPGLLVLEKESCEEKDSGEEKDSCEEKVHSDKESVDNGDFEILPKSSMKKPRNSSSENHSKGNVKWMDFVGKELVEIKEFEPEDEDSSDEIDGKATCKCSIL